MEPQTNKNTFRRLIVLLLSLVWQLGFAQLIYVNDGRDIYSFDPVTCEYNLVVTADRGFLDIAFDRHGNLYGCNTDLHRIDVSNGNLTKIAEIGERPLNGMVISYDGIAYMGDPGGGLYSYDFNTDVTISHGEMDYGCAGDFTFYKGDMYMAAFDNQIVKVNIEYPELSEVVITFQSDDEIVGIVSDYRGCDDTQVYGLTGAESEIYQIDFENLTLNLVCQLPTGISGGASTSEFLASVPVTLGTPLVIQPDCQSLTGSISFPEASGMGELNFKLGENEWQTDPDFNNLPAGEYSFLMKDEEGCLDSIRIELKPYPLLIIDEIIVKPSS
jgi:hypothetical protein